MNKSNKLLRLLCSLLASTVALAPASTLGASNGALSQDAIRTKTYALYQALQKHVLTKGNTYTIRIDPKFNFTIEGSGNMDMSKHEVGRDDVFCNILDGKEPGRFIFKNSEFACFLKRRATSEYSTTSTKERTECLIVPYMHIIEAHKLSLPLLTTLIINGFKTGTSFGSGDAYTLEINNGARQGIPHVHLHCKIRHNPPLAHAVQNQISDGEALSLK